MLTYVLLAVVGLVGVAATVRFVKGKRPKVGQDTAIDNQRLKMRELKAKVTEEERRSLELDTEVQVAVDEANRLKAAIESKKQYALTLSTMNADKIAAGDADAVNSLNDAAGDVVDAQTRYNAQVTLVATLKASAHAVHEQLKQTYAALQQRQHELSADEAKVVQTKVLNLNTAIQTQDDSVLTAVDGLTGDRRDIDFALNLAKLHAQGAGPTQMQQDVREANREQDKAAVLAQLGIKVPSKADMESRPPDSQIHS